MTESHVEVQVQIETSLYIISVLQVTEACLSQGKRRMYPLVMHITHAGSGLSHLLNY